MTENPMPDSMKVKTETISGKRVHYVDCPECGDHIAAVEGFTEGKPINDEMFRTALDAHLRSAHPKSAKARVH